MPILLYIVLPLGAMLSQSLTLPVLDFRARQMEMGHRASADRRRNSPRAFRGQNARRHHRNVETLSAQRADVRRVGARARSAMDASRISRPSILCRAGIFADAHAAAGRQRWPSMRWLLGESGILWRISPGAKLWTTPFLRVLLVHTYSFGSYTFAYVSAALEDADASREEAARSLGANRLKTFFASTWPAVRAPLLAAALVTFMAASAASFHARRTCSTTPRAISPSRDS